MKRLFTLLTAVLITATISAQAPEKFSYQAVVRNSGGVLVQSHAVGIKISILQGSAGGSVVYVETHNVATNTNGLATLEIGAGSVVSGNFATIDWSNGPYFLLTETDPAGGTDYTAIVGTSQLMSVPYALHSRKAEMLQGTTGMGSSSGLDADLLDGLHSSDYIRNETDPLFGAWDKSADISITNSQISNWSSATSSFLTGITSGQVTTALGFTPYNSTNPSGYTSNTGTVTSVAMSAPVGLTITGTPVTTSGTLALALTSGYAIPTTDQLFPGFGSTADKAANGNHTHNYSGEFAVLGHNHSGTYEPVIATGTTSQYWRGDKSWQTLNTDAIIEGTNLYYTNARTRAAISLTTTGNSGTATYTSGVINVPNYTLSGLGGQSELNGTGLVRMTGTSVSYDNSTYLTSFTEIDPNAVLLTGNQTIAGNKTFTGTTTVATPVNATDAANKAYVDLLQNQIDIIKNSLVAGGLVTDIDGNSYNTVKIGTQVWMAENLKTIKYNDGTAIPIVTDEPSWIALTTPAYCWYNNDEATNKATYGALYNWYTLDALYNGGKNVCPTGWHVPTDAEWTTLTTFLGGEGVAGGKLKETGTTHWLTPNAGATNETGFTALPGGSRSNNGTFSSIVNYGYWWSATQGSAGFAWSRYLFINFGNAVRQIISEKSGFSIRCLKD